MSRKRGGGPNSRGRSATPNTLPRGADFILDALAALAVDIEADYVAGRISETQFSKIMMAIDDLSTTSPGRSGGPSNGGLKSRRGARGRGLARRAARAR
jgi:hypothetical protein